LARTEKIVAIEPDNGSAMSYLAFSLILLGERERARDWMERALVLDPENQHMRYNFTCDLVHIGDLDAAIDMLAPLARVVSREFLGWWDTDPDLDALREMPRFMTMVAEAKARLAGEGDS
jgi:adenylate cyclase